MGNFENHLNSLIQLAISDQSFSDVERDMIYTIGKVHRFSDDDIKDMIEANLRKGAEVNVEFSALTFDEKFEYLYNIIQLMKIDRQVYLSEIRYCEELAVKLGFKKQVVNQLSPQIYADPTITSDHDALKKKARKFEMSN